MILNIHHIVYKISLDLFEKSYCPLDYHLAVCSPDVLHLFKDYFDFKTTSEFLQ
ncbi:unnamed protein product, partial [Rotaria sordida]